MPQDLPAHLRRQAKSFRSSLRTGSDEEKVRDALQLAMETVADILDWSARIEARLAAIEAKLGR